jgi:hypothetical protein
MNPVFFIMICFFLTIFQVHGQIAIEQIPLKTNRIELETGLSFEDNFQVVGKIFVENDLEIDKLQKEFGYITTTPKANSKGAIVSKYKAIIKPEKVVLSGEFNLAQFVGNDFSQIQNKGMKGSPAKISFEEMVKLVNQIPHTKATFIIAE